MHKAIVPLGCVLCLLLGAGGASAAGAHQHGVAQLTVATEGNRLELELSSPLESLVGFEHEPRNDKERKAVQAMKDSFRKPEALFAPSVAAQCSAAPAEVELPGGDSKDGHADMHAAVAFECKTPAALKDLEVKLFDSFPRLQRLKVQLVAGGKQSGTELTRQKRRLAW
ncbi:DUF2796 domain-containing protein [Noviherbaspirillum aerium]|uniref:DUF2796 domain-containing protein n=1 Tax=Noviherbaspirillum aerium TaxID=2588497 RepID=UPI00124F583E|nr:DUF2796 domain-containing protein [Noviherbaspirillum aerium]